MDLEIETSFYKSKKKELLAAHEGEYILIIGATILGFFETDESAYDFGINNRGNVPMLIMEIKEGDDIAFIPGITHGPFDAPDSQSDI